MLNFCVLWQMQIITYEIIDLYHETKVCFDAIVGHFRGRKSYW